MVSDGLSRTSGSSLGDSECWHISQTNKDSYPSYLFHTQNKEIRESWSTQPRFLDQLDPMLSIELPFSTLALSSYNRLSSACAGNFSDCHINFFRKCLSSVSNSFSSLALSLSFQLFFFPSPFFFSSVSRFLCERFSFSLKTCLFHWQFSVLYFLLFF